MSATCEIVEQLSTPRRMNLFMTKELLLGEGEAEGVLEAITVSLFTFKPSPISGFLSYVKLFTH